MEVHLIVKEALKLLRASLPTTIEIRQEIDPDCGTILADPTQIHQVVMNLCTNAYHAMRENRGIMDVRLCVVDLDAHRVATRSANHNGGFVELMISDTGRGMDEATLERVFEPFFTTKDVGEGSGMGLAIVHGIVASHDGTITVTSKPGKGTAFHVYLPRIGSEPTAEPVVVESVLRGKERILFIDDEESLAEIGKLNLERFGYHVTSRTNSLEALKLFVGDPERFDLIITDQTMPHMTGIDLAMQALRIRPEIPIILTTGFSETVTPEASEKLGIRRLIMKPLNPDDLARTIRKVLDGNEGPAA